MGYAVPCRAKQIKKNGMGGRGAEPHHREPKLTQVVSPHRHYKHVSVELKQNREPKTEGRREKAPSP
jgi:hypothetical protein